MARSLAARCRRTTCRCERPSSERESSLGRGNGQLDLPTPTVGEPLPWATTGFPESDRPNRRGTDDGYGERLSDNSERLYESDNGVLGRPHRSAASGRSGASATEMTQLRIDSLSLMYKKSPDPGNFPTASRHRDRPDPALPAPERTCGIAQKEASQQAPSDDRYRRRAACDPAAAG
jgi:hypothetical protein